MSLFDTPAPAQVKRAPIEWDADEDGLASTDGEWTIVVDFLGDGPPWVRFVRMPRNVVEYMAVNPGNVDAWHGHYCATLDNMHAQAEKLLDYATGRKKRTR